MKQFFFTLLCFALVGMFISCNFFDKKLDGDGARKPKENTELSQSKNEQVLKHDSIKNESVCEMDSIRKAIIKSEKDLNEMKQSIQRWRRWEIVALIIAIVALVVVYIKNPLGFTTQKQVEQQIKNSLDDSEKIKELDKHVNTLLSQQKSQQNSILSQQLQDIENRVKKLEKTSNEVNKPTPITSHSINKQDCQRTGYAKINSGPIFTDILDSNQEGCVFSIKFTGIDKGEFTIISLDKIKSRNGWQDIVECTGASIGDATNFKVEKYGICEKYDESAWQVKEKLKIKLLR